MGPPSYMRSVVCRNVFMLHMTVLCPSPVSHIGRTSTTSLAKWRIRTHFNILISTVCAAACTGDARAVAVVPCAIAQSHRHCVPSTAAPIAQPRSQYCITCTDLHSRGRGKAKQWRLYGRRWWNKVFPPNATVNWIPSVTMLHFTSSCQLPSC